MAVTRREQEMLDLAERGLNYSQIAEQMGIRRASVERTMGMLIGGLGVDRRHLSMMEHGRRRLAEAIETARAF